MGNRTYDVAVIGGGIAGYTAALTLKNFGKDFLWVGAKPFGDKLLKAEHVRNFPSFSGNGVELAALLERQMIVEEIPFTKARIDGVYAADRGFDLMSGREVLHARSVILATGVETKVAKGAAEYLGRGVSYCAVCDGALYKNKRIACEISSKEYEDEVEYLAGIAEKVFVFCRYEGAHFHAANIELRQGKIGGIGGDVRVTEVLTESGEHLAVSGVFFLKDSAPPSVLVGGLQTEGGHVKVARDMSTHLSGLFAAGDVTGRPYQYIKAAGEGLVAAFSACDYLARSQNAPRS